MIDAIYEEPERIESKLISEHWGNDIWQNRRARVLFNESSKLFSVELFDAQQKVRTVIREKDLTGTYEIKNIRVAQELAEQAAENWCLGYES
tara:strand:+ start:145 stop:420 length:276 start_codon:yes stop_codon:yes gene_type:complete